MLVLTRGTQQCFEIIVNGETIVIGVIKTIDSNVRIAIFADKKKTKIITTKKKIGEYWKQEKFGDDNELCERADQETKTTNSPREHARDGDQ